MEVKNRKNKYIPYRKINDKKVTIMWDYKPIYKKNAKGETIETPLAVWQEKTFNYIPSFKEIKKVILDYYNSEIDNEILTGFTWNEMKIWLSSENQFNYKAAYDLVIQTNGENLPIIFKFGDDETPIYYEFKTIEDITNFYTSCINYIQKTLLNGWEKKENINWAFYEKNDIY